MPPGHVIDDHDLTMWVANEVTNAGAFWSSHPVPQFQYIAKSIGTSDVEAVELADHEITFFADQSTLKIEFQATQTGTGWDFTTYWFHYRTTTRKCVFRYDKHPEHYAERKWGSQCHLHLGGGRRRQMRSSPEVELDQVLDAILRYQQTGVFVTI